MTFISTALEKSTSSEPTTPEKKNYLPFIIYSHAAVLPENKLITKLAFLRCAKNELKGFQWEESYTDVLNVAMHHADEQVHTCISAHGIFYCLISPFLIKGFLIVVSISSDILTMV